MSLIPVSHVCHPCILFRTDLRCTGISGLNPKASARVSRYELSHNFGRQTLGSCHLVREGVKNIFEESVDKVDLSTCQHVSWRILELVRLFFCACVCVCRPLWLHYRKIASFPTKFPKDPTTKLYFPMQFMLTSIL